MIGKTIGHYRLESELGRGGFGAVYLGVHLHLEDIKVAVKVFHPELSTDDEFIRLLRRECQVLHSLSHPGIVAFRDLVVEADATAIVLELLVGRDLAKVMEAGQPQPAEQVVELLRSILQSLAHGHRMGIVHRDIKPGNIFQCADGNTKLMDYGIAKATHGTQATQSGMVTGTLDYMSAERFDGQSPPSADVYAAGLVAWGLLAGRKACPSGDIPTKIGWHLRQGAADIRTVRPAAPAWLAEYLLALTATDCALRPVDAGIALELLDTLQTGTHPSASLPEEPIGAPRPPVPVVVPETVSISAPVPDEPVPPPRRVAAAAAAPMRRDPRANPAPSVQGRPHQPSRESAGNAEQRRAARRAAPVRKRTPTPYVEPAARRIPWASLFILLVAIAAGGFIISLLLQGN